MAHIDEKELAKVIRRTLLAQLRGKWYRLFPGNKDEISMDGSIDIPHLAKGIAKWVNNVTH